WRPRRSNSRPRADEVPRSSASTSGGASWLSGTVGVAADILQASVECIIDGLEWKLRGEHKH
ncbi:MAG: hypothetical protein ACREOR_06440, partial [Candidatus Binatia bacterium]